MILVFIVLIVNILLTSISLLATRKVGPWTGGGIALLIAEIVAAVVVVMELLERFS